MKNKKGFTIIELLSVIVILGIVITLGIFSISSIRKTILDKQYKNVKAEIELAAEKYYADTESNEVYVETLISEGYLKADNKSMIITDPRDGTSLNCFLVTIDENEDASLKEEDRSVDGKCIDASTSNRSIKIVTSDESEISDGWYKAPIILKAKLTKEGTYSFIWKSDLNPNTLAENITYDLNELYTERGNVIDDVFYVTATGENETLEAIGKRVRIDGIVPNIKSLEIPDKDKWTKTKTLKANVTDIGSGIDGYIVSNENCENIDLKDYHKIGDVPNPNDVKIEYEITKNGTYTFCVSDKAGNIKKYKEDIVIDRIDDIPPLCDYKENYEWTQFDVNVFYGCKDEQSGCEKITSKYEDMSCYDNSCYSIYKYDNTVDYANIENTIGEFYIYDKAGNMTKCPIKDGENKKTEISVKLDKTKPVIDNFSIKRNNSLYNGKDVTISFSISDFHSGISYFTYGSIRKGTTEYGNLALCQQNGLTYNCSFNYTFSSENGSGNVEYFYVTAYDKVGNSVTEKKDYRLYRICDETNFNGYGDCSVKCGIGEKAIFRTDKYFGSSCYGGTESCNAGSCCAKTYSKTTTGSCSNTCGSGYKTTTTTYYSSINQSFCGQDVNDKVPCSDKSGCKPVNPPVNPPSQCTYINPGCSGNGKDYGTGNCKCGPGVGGFPCGCKCC